MKHRSKSIFGIVTLLILATTVFALYSCYEESSFDNFTKIEEGFSSELTDVLYTKYQLTIPESAHFLAGINTNAFRDPSVVILFECPVDSRVLDEDNYGCKCVFQTLGLADSNYAFGGLDEEISASWYGEMGGMLDYRIVDKTDPHTFISYSINKDMLVVRFIGRHPGITFQ